MEEWYIYQEQLRCHTQHFFCVNPLEEFFFLNRASIQKMMTCMAEHWSRVYFLPIMSVLGPGQHREIRTCSSTPIAPAKNVFNLKMSNEGRSLWLCWLYDTFKTNFFNCISPQRCNILYGSIIAKEKRSAHCALSTTKHILDPRKVK